MARTAAGGEGGGTLAPRRPTAAELERPAPIARRLAKAFISPNTRQGYSGAPSGTNDKAGSSQNLLRWVSTRTTKETLVSVRDYRYPHMQER